MPRSRPQPPRGRWIDALAAPSYPIDVAAALCGHSEDSLFAAVEAGWLPPWAANKIVPYPTTRLIDPRWLWRFSYRLTGDEIEEHMTDGFLWLNRMHAQDCDLTARWAADPYTADVDVAQIAEWCRVANPHPLTADRAMFAGWCADHMHPPMLTAHRHRTLWLWFEMLRSEGVPQVADVHPAERTEVKVTAR